jgi:integrase
MFASLRIGETLALKWRDIDFEKGYISIQNAITLVVDFDDDGNVLKRNTIISDTKTAASARENPIPDILLNALKEYREHRRLEEALLKGKVSLTKPDDLVFGTSQGKLRTYWGTNSLFRKFLEKHKLHDKGIHFHKLRHTFSNMLFEAGENPKVVQELMGHKDVRTTMIYNSVDKKQLQSAKDTLDKISSEILL